MKDVNELVAHSQWIDRILVWHRPMFSGGGGGGAVIRGEGANLGRPIRIKSEIPVRQEADTKTERKTLTIQGSEWLFVMTGDRVLYRRVPWLPRASKVWKAELTGNITFSIVPHPK